MLRTFPLVVLVTFIVNALGEQHLRAQPSSPSTLATEASTLGKPHDPRSIGMQKTLVNFMSGLVHPRDKEDAKAVTDFKEFGVMNSGEIFVTFVLWFILYALLAFYYHNYVLYYQPVNEDREKEEERIHFKDFQEFKSGLFDCTTGPGIMFWSCCCPGIRWADTMSKLNIHRFWPGFWLMTGLYAIGFIPLCTLVCFSIVVVYMTYHRQEFRKKFEFEEQGGATVFTDCLTYCFCMCCAVAQEARHTRQATVCGHPAIASDSDKS